MTSERRADVLPYILSLNSANPLERLEAASKISRTCILYRRNAGARGGIHESAEPLVPDEYVMSAIRQMGIEDRDDVKREIAFALGEIAGASAIELLARLTDYNNSAETRAAAVESIGKIGGPKAVEVLLRTMGYDPNPYVRSRAALYIGGLMNRDKPVVSDELVRRIVAEADKVFREDVSGYVSMLAGTIHTSLQE